ncbi:MAG: type II toxin-antitoxin system HicB family antitoxin [Clostridia bacterium]|nr:type II toxin-antitoxin system HicB family antitoxin [Clostridia bacterium]
MNNTMEYKSYIGSVEFSEEDSLFYGRVLGIRALVSYEGENAHDLIADFHSAVDDYLALCEAEGIKPETAYKGSFNVRISPELHKAAVIAAMRDQISLNSFVEDAIAVAVEGVEPQIIERYEIINRPKCEFCTTKNGELYLRLKAANGEIIMESAVRKATR